MPEQKCPKCGAAFDSQESLQRHAQDQHSEEAQSQQSPE